MAHNPACFSRGAERNLETTLSPTASWAFLLYRYMEAKSKLCPSEASEGLTGCHLSQALMGPGVQPHGRVCSGYSGFSLYPLSAVTSAGNSQNESGTGAAMCACPS